MLRRFIGLAVIMIGLAALSAVIYMLFIKDYGSSPVTLEEKREEATSTLPVNQLPDVVKTIPASSTAPVDTPIAAGDQTRDDLLRLASAFGERFGSYSNQSDFDNIVSLKPFMSRRMWTWAESFVHERNNKEAAGGEIYYGISSRTTKKEVLTFDEDGGRASIRLKMRRREASGTMDNFSSPFDQELEILFIKENGAWKVDSAIWQKEK